jgi:protoporphyrinogen/coproporphyrinogen III oxidase
LSNSAAPPIAVVGAGLAGLTAASAFRRAGLPTVCFEAGKRIAGLATSFRDEDGFSYDFGAHFITNRLAAAIGIGASCRTVRHYGETVVLGGRTFSYPLGLLSSPRFVLSALASHVRAVHASEPTTAAEWFRRVYGARLADEVAIPLVEAWSGQPADRLAPSVGDKIPGGIGRTIGLKMASRLLGRAIAQGYCRAQPETIQVWHVYPEGGVHTICERLARDLDGAIHLESPVDEILVDQNQVVAVRVHGREQEVAAVFSTAPVNVLAKLVRGTSALQDLAGFRYRPMVFINLRLKGRGLLPGVVTWTPEASFPFFRLTEATLSMPWLAPAGKTLITVDIGCEVGDRYWSMPDDQLAELSLAALDLVVPGIRQRYLGCRVLRTPIAYPVFLNEYEEARQKLNQGTGVRGLYTIGRNGEFAHILMEDVYWRTLRKAHHALHELRLPSAA